MFGSRIPKLFKYFSGEIDDKSSELELNVHLALKPVNFLLLFLGIQRYSYHSGKVVSRTIMSKTYSLFCFFGIFGSYFFINLRHMKIPNTLPKLTDYLAYVFSLIAAGSSICVSLFYDAKVTRKFIYNFECVDQLLDLPAKCFTDTRSNVFIGMTVASLSVGTAVIHDYMAWVNPDSNLMYSMYASMILIACTVFQYVLDIWLVTFRLRALTFQLIYCKNGYFNTNSVSLEPYHFKSWDKMNQLMVKSDVFDTFGDRISRMRKIYRRLADNIDIINSFYGIQVK